MKRLRRWRWLVLLLLLVGGSLMAGHVLRAEMIVDQSHRPGPGNNPPPDGRRPPPRPRNDGGGATQSRQEQVVPAPAAPQAAVQAVELMAGMTLAQELHTGNAEHADQAELLALVQAGENEEAFAEAFELGDELFETTFNSLDGVGAQVGNGLRFSQLPRADLDGPGEWANHFPQRITGPNAEACNACHGTPVDDGAGRAANNNVRDPLHSSDIALFIQRNTPHVFAAGAVQVLTEEMTEALQSQRDAAVNAACADNRPQTVALTTKGVEFGSLIISPRSSPPCQVDFDSDGVVGVDGDMIVRPFQWKGVDASIRGFNRGAAHQELGMQSVEIVGECIIQPK